jgi:tRNA(fMet)-specific endonuclease VapC
VTEPRFLLDTNVCVYLAEGLSKPLLRRVEECEVGELVTSSIAFTEFARGIDWTRPGAEDSVRRLFEAIAIQPFDEQAARAYAALPFARHRFDRLIGAHAIALRLVLVTANVGDYRDLHGLEIEDWTK